MIQHNISSSILYPHNHFTHIIKKLLQKPPILSQIVVELQSNIIES